MQADAQALAPIASILTDQVRLYARAAEISDAHAPADAIRSVWNERQALLQEFKRKLHALGVSDETHGTLWAQAISACGGRRRHQGRDRGSRARRRLTAR